MQTKWIVFLTAVYLFGTMFGGMMEGTYLESNEASLMESVIGIETYHIMGISIPKPNTEWLSSLGKMLLWDYAMFKNPNGTANEWAVVKWLLFIPISLGLMVTFVTTFIPILLQGIRAVKFW